MDYFIYERFYVSLMVTRKQKLSRFMKQANKNSWVGGRKTEHSIMKNHQFVKAGRKRGGKNTGYTKQ